MPYSSTFGPSRGARRTGRWFVLVFLCVALVLVLVPAVSLGHATSKWASQKCKVTLCADRGCVLAGTTVKLTAKAWPCASGTTFTLMSKVSPGGWTTVATATPDKCGKAIFKVTVMRSTQYQVTATWPKGSATSNVVCVKVQPKLTLCVQPGQYGGGVSISGTLVPGLTGGKVCITIAKIVHCNRLMKVATLTVPLTQGPGDSSVYATTWAGPTDHGTYVFTAKVAGSPGFCGACAIKVVKL